MTNVIYNEHELSLSFNGHAGNEYICAGLSTLVGALLGMSEIAPAMMGAEIKRCDEEGDFSIRCKPEAGYEWNCKSVLRTCFVGAGVLAENFPDFVCVKEDNGNVSDR